MKHYTGANVYDKGAHFSFEIQGIPKHQRIIFEGFDTLLRAEVAMKDFIKLNRLKKVFPHQFRYNKRLHKQYMGVSV